MTKWTAIELGECAKFQEGYVNPSQTVARYFDGPVKWLRAVDLNDSFVSSTTRTLSEEGFRSAGKSAKLFSPGTLAISKSGTIGRLGILKDYMCGNRAVINIVPDASICHPLFIFFVLRHNRSKIETLAEGSVQKNLYVPLLSKFRFELPTLSVQQRIVDILGSLDEKIELNRRMNETLEGMAQEVFRDWFVDFGPTRRKLEGATNPLTIMGGLVQDTERAQTLADLFPAALGDEGLPEGWRLGATSALVEFNPKEPLKKGTPAPYSDMSSLPTSGPLADPPVEREYGSGMRFRNGDALLARITPCLENGKSAFVDFLPDAQTIGWGSTEFYVLRSRKGVPAPFAYLLVRHPEFRAAAIASMTGTSGRQRAQVDRLEDFPFANVPMELLGEFGKFILPMFDKITANGVENRTLAATRDLLLPKLMSGEVRLSEAEDLMEAAQ
jgi:type I restriction enzyme S subunit